MLFAIKLFLAQQYWAIFMLYNGMAFGEHLTVNMVKGSTPTSVPVSYSCSFVHLWTAATHPNDYPSSPHWSPMVMTSHNEDYYMWSGGSKATQGVKIVAETGSVRTILKEFSNAGKSIGSVAVASGAFFPSKNKQSKEVTDNLMMDKDHRYISSISMVAPSPDWFTGLANFSPIQDGMWLNSFTIDTYPWDAGTDSGTSYSARDQATKPQEDIYELVPETIPDSKVFLSPDGTKVEPVAQWVCTLKDIPCTEKKNDRFYHRLNKQGKLKTKACKWLGKQKKKRKKRLCERDDSRDGFGPAKEVCPVTCEMCS